MICPYCKNEKLQAPACPSCGLGEKEALLKAADLNWTQGKQELALDYYGRYLALEPGDLEVAYKSASRLCSLALDWRDPLLFEKADRQIGRILEDHWDWQAGHESRLNLYICFGKLDSLKAWYGNIREKDPSRAAYCEQMVKTIQLVEKFKDEKPEVPEGLEDIDLKSMFLGSNWVYLAAIVLIPAVALILAPLARKGLIPWSIVILSSGSMVFCLFLFSLWRIQKFKQKPKPQKPKDLTLP